VTSKYEQEEIRKVREERCEIDGCQMQDTGVCALHDVEVERRKGMKELVDLIPAILTRLNIMTGTTIFVGIIMVGSFAYTTLVKNELKNDAVRIQQENNAAVSELRSLVHEIAVTQGKNIQAQDSQLRELARLNNSLEGILDRQVRHEESVNSRIDHRFDSWGTRKE
jgi:hypothetical protein